MGGPTGKMKFYKVVDASGKEFQERLLYGFDYLSTSAIWIAILIITIYLLVRKKQDKKIIGLLWGWILLILVTQFWSKRIVSEYYFTNILPVLIALLALFLDDIDKRVVWISGILYLGINGYWLATRMDYDQSYFYKKQIVEVIKEDAIKNGYPCVALNFIADPGVGVGFRYLLWYNQVDQVKATSEGVPIYNVFIPWQLGYQQNPVHFGRLGVITPPRPVKLITKDECKNSENQMDPLLGYTD
jgi:hypothetical protein